VYSKNDYASFKTNALKLRRTGLSLSEIQEKIKVSKSTISLWCREVKLSKKNLKRLQKRKSEGSKKGRALGRQKNINKRIEEIKLQQKIGRETVGKLSRRDAFVIGIALYAAEGGKKGKHISFANTDPEIIKFMMGWFRDFCKISNDKFRGAIWIHKNLDAKKAKSYWSHLTKIPPPQFHKTYMAENKTESKKIRKTKHEDGGFSIRICDLKTLRLIMGWMSGIFSPNMI
jgi:hypothetical protein